jgi:glyoxylase-like metal-dependent hydrolase (beta-lactamase superfamily II)
VDLIEVGPAHTVGDVLVLVPDARTLYAGDVLFSAGTPIVWSGPIERWIAALDLILEMDVDTIVPGHGPVAGKGDVAEMRAYLATVDEQARTRYADGLSVDEAIDTIDLGRFASRPEHGRLAQNVVSVYRQLDPDMALPSPVEVLGRIAALEGFAAADAR